MSDKTIDTAALLDRLLVLRAAHRDEINAIIEELQPWQAREYAWSESDEDSVVQPNESKLFQFGVSTVVPGTAVVGLPESAETSFGVDKAFHIQGLVVDEDVAPHFDISYLVGGARVAWRTTMPVAAMKFAPSAVPVVQLDVPIEERCKIALCVTNTSKEPQKFRAKVIGRERADLAKAKA